MRIAETYSREYLRASASEGDSARYIFIVGLPRSGTTLLERILTGLQGVRSNGETDKFSQALLRFTPAGTGDVFGRAVRADPSKVAEAYAKLAGATSHRDAVIEKLPLNYLYIGAIQRALPNSIILLMTRPPLDSCFAMYRTLFGTAYPFSYDFEDVARYYAAYERLMNHWRRALGARIYEIPYARLVTQPAVVGAAVAEHCGLRWEATAIEVQRNSSVSMTASATQVRRPIYQSSVNRWRKYRTHLEPLAHQLEKRGVNASDCNHGI